MANVMWVAFGVAVGAVLAWLVAQASAAKTTERLRGAEAQAAAMTKELSAERATGLLLRAEAERAKATLESERKSFEEQKTLLAGDGETIQRFVLRVGSGGFAAEQR